jgi:transcriptional regulator with XRE-family HTH domain
MKIDTRKLEREITLRGWDYQDLAKQASLSPATVSRLIGGADARLSTLRRIARALTDAPALPGMDLLVDDERLIPGQWTLIRPDRSMLKGFGQPPAMSDGDRLEWHYSKDRGDGNGSQR